MYLWGHCCPQPWILSPQIQTWHYLGPGPSGSGSEAGLDLLKGKSPLRGPQLHSPARQGSMRGGATFILRPPGAVSLGELFQEPLGSRPAGCLSSCTSDCWGRSAHTHTWTPARATRGLPMSWDRGKRPTVPSPSHSVSPGLCSPLVLSASLCSCICPLLRLSVLPLSVSIAVCLDLSLGGFLCF